MITSKFRKRLLSLPVTRGYYGSPPAVSAARNAPFPTFLPEEFLLKHLSGQTLSLLGKNPILNFSANPLPLPAKPSLPGPGQYEIVDYAGPPKHFISSASFVSNTSRWTMAPSQPGLPGPATYKPEFPGKQSFLYNEDKKWIPVL